MPDPKPKILAPIERGKRAIREAPAMTTVEEIEKRVTREVAEAMSDAKYEIAAMALSDIYDLEQRYKKELSELADKYRALVHRHAPEEDSN